MAAVSPRYLELAALPKSSLEAVFQAGTRPDFAALAGFEFRGYNHARAATLLGIRKFIKVFYLSNSGQSFGCNTPVIQNGLHSAWVARPQPDEPRRYAFFRVERDDQDSADPMRRHALVLDYARGGNPAYQVARMLRDYLVRVEPGSDDLLLGKAFLAAGGQLLPLGFFLIERSAPLADAAALAGRS
jgi:hypothetical protein